MAAPPFSFGSPVWPGLAKVAEEAGEVVQVIGKFLATGGTPGPDGRHWDGSDLPSRLSEELADLSAAVDFVVAHNGLDPHRIAARTARKRALFETWHAEHSDPATTPEEFGEPQETADPAASTSSDPDPAQVAALADALYGLEWQSSLYDTPRCQTTDRYEARARRLMANPAWPTAS